MIRSLLKRTKFHRAALPLLAMLLTTTTAWADEVSVSNVNELSNAVMYGVTEDRTITLTGDNKEWTLTQTLGAWANYKITIDLNGHTITSESILYRGYNDTDLTIMDSKGGGSLVYTGGQLTSAIGVNSGGKLTIKSGEINSPNSLAIQNDGTLTITGGTINNSLYGIRNTGIANISNCTITCSEFSVYNDAVSNYSGNYIGNLTIGSGVTLNGDVYNHYNAKINATAKAYVPGAPVKAHSDVDPEDVLPGGSYYASLIDAVNAANNATNDITIKMLDDESLKNYNATISNTNHIDGDNTNPIVKVTLDMNGHTVSSTGATVIKINQRANVEITDFSDEKNGTICGRSNSATSIENYGTLSVSNIKIINTYSVKDNTNVTKGIFTHDNSTLTIGSGVSFSNLKYGIYTYYNEEQDPWKARAMTRTVSNEPAKLYINALPTFESCIYDIELINDIIMDFSKATAPLALVDGQKKITFNHFNPTPVKIFTKDYKRAFTNPTTGVITNPNDIFEYYYGENYGEIYYAFGEAIFSSTNDTHLSVVTSDASGTISNLFGYSEASPDNSNSYLFTALNNLENGGTVQLFSDITGATKPYVINKGTAEAPVTLDLNGHTITGDMNIESGSTLILTDSSNGNGHIKGAVTVPLDELQDRLANWSDKADVIKSTGSCGSSQNWSLTKNSGDKLGDNFPLKLTIDGSSYMADYSETSQDIALSTAPWAAQCSNITEISLGKNINTIGTYAFAYCNRVNEVTIPENLLYIRDNAFKGMTELKKVYIKNVKTDNALITHIDGCPFADCSSDLMINLTNANVIAAYINDYYWQKEYGSKFYAEGYCGVADANGGKNIKWSLMPINGETINIGNEDHPDNRQAYALSITKNTDDEDANLAMKESPGYGNWLEDFSHPNGLHHRIKTATIEEGIKNIGASAFASCKNLESATVPSTVTAIGEHGFSGCNKLLGINIPDGVTCIGERTFYDCNSLTSIDIPYTVTSIGEGAFYNCRSLTNIVIPSKVETIDKSAFSGCTALKTVRVMATTPPKIADYGDNGQYAPFSYCESLKYFFVPDVVAYSEAYGWKQDYILPLLRADKTTLFAQDASNTYMTWCDEFEWKKPKDCTVYTVSGVNSEQVQVAEVEGDVIPAYTPVLIKRAEGELTADIKADFSNVVESVSTSGTSYTNINKDTRAYQGTVIANFDGGCVYGNTGAVQNPNNKGWVANGEDVLTYALYGDKFLLIDTDEGIPTHRFIMRVSYGDVGKARSLTIGVGGDTTGMEELKNEKIEELNSEWYDLQGRKLGSKPTKKGLYINNGKKIVIK